MKYILGFVSIILISATCKRNEFDPEGAAKQYCDCMNKNGSPKSYVIAKANCDLELASKNKFYKIYWIEMNYRHYTETLPQSLVDSSTMFVMRMDDYFNKYCGPEMLRNTKRDSVLKK
jgi:hypothetical protein